jgi:hypothetical protein
MVASRGEDSMPRLTIALMMAGAWVGAMAGATALGGWLGLAAYLAIAGGVPLLIAALVGALLEIRR